MRSVQFLLTPAAGKRLIARGIAAREDVQRALWGGRVLVIAGTTNVFVANELLRALGEEAAATPMNFHRGVVTAPGAKMAKEEFLGDLLVDHGKARFVDALPEICAELGRGDVIMKGANAVHLASGTAGVLIGNPKAGGTIHEASGAVYARRAKLILPVGVEKRVERPVAELERLVNDPEAEGLRLTQAPGEAFTEIDALRVLCGCDAEIVASGGVNGAEGCVYLQARGGDLQKLEAIVEEVRREEPVQV